MVEKKINLNQPILSVRRHSQRADEMDVKTAFPTPRPYLNSGPVRSPGSVPFQWERAPGQPKEQTRQQTQYSTSNNNVEAFDCDEACADELDSLSRTESFLSSSSISSLTGLDDQDADPSRRFRTDQMDLSEPLYARNKQSAVQEQSEEVKKEIVNEDKAAFWYRPTFAKGCSYYKEREESDLDRNQNENLIAVCCLLPRSCIKSSVCHLNPVPAMNVRTRLAMFQARGVQSCSSSADSLSETENEDTLKPVVKTDEVVCICDETKHNCTQGFESCKKNFKTLQELLAYEDSRKELRFEKGLYQQDTENTEVKNVKKQIQRATTLGNSREMFPVPPPLPRSPSDSWLFRTLPSVKASTRFTNKY